MELFRNCEHDCGDARETAGPVGKHLRAMDFHGQAGPRTTPDPRRGGGGLHRGWAGAGARGKRPRPCQPVRSPVKAPATRAVRGHGAARYGSPARRVGDRASPGGACPCRAGRGRDRRAPRRPAAGRSADRTVVAPRSAGWHGWPRTSFAAMLHPVASSDDARPSARRARISMARGARTTGPDPRRRGPLSRRINAGLTRRQTHSVVFVVFLPIIGRFRRPALPVS